MRCLPLADDFGVSATNVDAIIRCIDAGSLLGTSLMANGVALDYGAARLGERLRKISHLRVGIHLNLLEGRCSASPDTVPLLADERGFFRYSLGRLCLALPFFSSRKKAAFIEQTTIEWLAQVHCVREAMRKTTQWADAPFYIDGHQHVHAIPLLWPALAAVIHSGPATHVRVPKELRYACPAPAFLQGAGTARRELLSIWGKSLKSSLDSLGVPTPDFFIGAFCSGAMTLERLQAGLAKTASYASCNALVEIMTHPGAQDTAQKNQTDLFSRFYAAPEREAETAMLLNPTFQQTLAKHDASWQIFSAHQPTS